nr:hypothetical protein [Tanacetum cinerariifolium]
MFSLSGFGSYLSTNEPVNVVASAKILVAALPNVDNLSNAKTGRNLGANGPTSMGFDMSKVECYNCHRKGHFARECRSPKDTKRNVTAEPQRRNFPVETSTSNALVLQCDGVGSYDWSFQAKEEPTNYVLMTFTSSSSSSSDNEVASCSKAYTKAYATLQSHYDKLTNDLRKSQFDVISYETGLEYVEARLLVYQQNKTVFEEDIKLLKLEVQLRDNALVVLRQKFKKAEQEKDDLNLKLENFWTSSKNLSQLLASQTNDKTFLGYNTQVFTSFMFDCDEMFSSETDESLLASPKYDRYHSGDGYHVVPPPHTGTFMPPKPDLVFHDAPNVNETAYTAFNVELSPTKPDKDLSYTLRPSTLIIEDWVSESEDSKAKILQNAPSFVQTTKQVKTPRPSVKPVENSIPVDNQRTTIPKPISHENNKNRKTCFVCKSLTYLIKDCDYYEKKMAQTPARNHAQWGNHQQYARMTLPNPKRHVGNPQHALKDKGVLDSRCSRHMRRNMSYLSDFEELNGGYVAFGGNPKGEKISRKGKIRTGKLDFDDVYFVKELKFNLFSVSQMCDKKNNVLFTDTEYLTCLFAKATLDESNLWHRRLGRINFKTMNKLVKDPSQYPDDPNMPELKDITYFDNKEDVGAEADFTNLETNTTVSPIPTTRVHKDHHVTQIIGDLSSTTQTRSMTKVVKDQGGFTQINNEDFHTCMFACFFSQDEPKKNTDGDATFEVKKPEFEGEKPESEVYVSPSSSAQTKKFERYLKGKPHLGLWYPKDSPFNLVTYSNSDYADASLDWKSTTEGCQFFRCRLFSWQCKKQKVVATLSTDAEYVAAAS